MSIHKVAYKKGAIATPVVTIQVDGDSLGCIACNCLFFTALPNPNNLESQKGRFTCVECGDEHFFSFRP